MCDRIQLSALESIEVYEEPPKELTVWDEQRLVDKNKVAEIERSIDGKYSFGIWTVCRLGFKDLFLIDGQHRYIAYQKKRKNSPGFFINNRLLIALRVFTVFDKSEILELFRNINKQTPVPDIYFEPMNKKAFILSIEEFRKTKFGERSYPHRPPLISLASPDYRQYLAELLFDVKKSKNYKAIDIAGLIANFDSCVSKIMLDRRPDIDYLSSLEYEDTYSTAQEYIDDTFSAKPWTFGVLTIFVSTYIGNNKKNNRKAIEDVYRLAEEHSNSFLGIFAKKSIKGDMAIKFRDLFWRFTTSKSKKIIDI